MSFLDTCIQDSLPIWRSCLETPFLRRMADGTLDEECFKGYIVDDSLYLREYSKVFAWGMIHSNDMEEIRNYYSLLAFVNEAEDSTRRYYLKRYGLLDEEIQPLPLRPENRAYVDYMLNAAKNAADAADCMMACLPCMLSYGWIFGEMLKNVPAVQNTPYAMRASARPGRLSRKRSAPGFLRSGRPTVWKFSVPARSMSIISGKWRPGPGQI